ncbi:hypothetical protein LTR10_011642 [Elasticomyces elasticus]|uniref:Vacuolar membrane PQ loop repeat protein n=1 Tax=Exophiala sideris TaxID=1016849 RepID=A0ABR0JD04_9EURO|nr:hypothetical protein LTR10_011642 [Elasticomyces elasticus]KAK5031900.1 hypothetical protein LTS07_004521 [Exophiala sideris]KAK5040829.1 hypothetical protein LTR13_003130 [Exophiala sideris]KAK5061836.1 hypothetical protein LTR69_005020 [Exophiala sideris]KAK5184536.1 hypothetical protein LTR44_003211 [Eurotiomycetes sp. CCFEE 6388]
MASLLSSLSSDTAVHLTTREALSGIFGSVSLACWIFLLVPQLIENYRNHSAEAISLSFIFVWFIGDICNLAGALWAGLVPVVIAIGVYFCIADGVLIGQCLYYSIVNKRREGKALLARQSSTAEDTEEEPLLRRTRTNSITIPGSGDRRRSSASGRRRMSAAAHDDHLAKILEESDASGTRLWFKNAMSVLAIFIIGAAGWALAYESGAWKPSPTSTDTEEEKMAAGAQILGYASAVAYLGARIPQIIKNAREKSCEGLSLLFFILSLMGNLTYGAGILFHSTEHDYVMKNLPWLIGSLGTMVEDVVIFAQFHMYAAEGKDREEEAIA